MSRTTRQRPSIAALRALGETDQVIVVDNSGSTDVRRRHAPERRGLHRSAGANLGFAAGANLALRRLLADHAATMCCCSTPTPASRRKTSITWRSSCTSPLIRALRASLRGSSTATAEQQRVTWPFPSPFRMWMEAVGLGRVRAPRGRSSSERCCSYGGRRSSEVGELDERFFLYAEETDWQRRAARLGWRAALVPDVVAVHDGAGSSGDPSRREVLFHAAQETTYGSGTESRLGAYRSALRAPERPREP